MAEQTQQALHRKVNGTSSGPSDHHSESTKGKAPSEASSINRTGRGRGSGDKRTDASRNPTGNEAAKPPKAKAHNEGEKLVLRRLPPGMTQTECITILGPEWELGKGKVDWVSWKPGKTSNDASKPSRPARMNLHIMRKDDLMLLGDVVRSAVWEDAKGTFNDPALIAPPSLEFSIYKKVPGNKRRTDTRQGTIDQDPEFMAFLEELANPPPPKESTDADLVDDAAKTETKVTTTPLIEYLKEKKNSKAKEGGSGKNAKHGRQETSNSKSKSAGKDEDGSKKKSKGSKTDKTEKAPKETVKILTKKAAAAAEQVAEAVKANANQANQSHSANAAEAPKSRRAGIAAAARILQRDLGLSPGSAHRRARQDAAKADADAKATTGKDTSPNAAETAPPPTPAAEAPSQASKNASSSSAPAASKSQNSRRNKGAKNAEKSKPVESQATAPPNPPVILKKKNDTESSRASAPAPAASQETSGKASNNTPTSKSSGKGSNASAKKAASVSANATRGFVKHANASQGVTEPLLREALSAFGTVTFIEVDKRKGFAYVDFSNHEGLVKAITSSPVPVAQGTVQVLERKDKKPAAAPAATPAAAATTGSAAGNSTTGGGGTEKSSSSRNRRGRGGGGKGAGGNNNGSGNAANTANASAPQPAG
ncbi:Smg-4/UPF3 family-domain-containing protein [Stachybotrys elegans]|uniref:Smg-4/UPF3 family-domain-containing protein n=1 Tax=Stachybotrys elegans TaxID=80388 RepID=A0A8K0SST6_9HYPO|nr:Smg-4/UPF3 family-domain-containing protein [Stachybotrys elegans]